MFQVNDMVLYGTNGVCKVVDIDLKPIYASNSTVFVPVNNEKLTSKMRYVLTKEEIDEKIRSISKEHEAWMDDERERKEHFKDMVSRADTFELIQLIEMLMEHRKKVMERGKKLHVADERMLQEAEKMICDEFSFVLGIPKEDVPSYITSSMRENV